jgi:hypothetical protein
MDELDRFLAFYRGTKNPQLRSFLKNLYDKQPEAYRIAAGDEGRSSVKRK